MKKNALKVVAGGLYFAGTCIASIKLAKFKKRHDEKLALDKEDTNVDEIVSYLIKYNAGFIPKCVGDTNGTWIFTYDHYFDMRILNIPPGYTLLAINPYRNTYYALAQS